MTDMSQNIEMNNVAPETGMQQEKMLSQSEVNALVGRARQEAREKALAQAAATQQQVPQQGYDNNMDDILNAARQAGREELNNQMAAQYQRSQINSFANKIVAAEDRFPDLSEKVKNLGLAQAPQLIELVNYFPNTADIVNDLVENPEKIGVFVANINSGFPQHAVQAMKRLSDSIANNNDAKKAYESSNEAKSPVKSLSPSNLGKDDGSAYTISDLRLRDKERRSKSSY